MFVMMCLCLARDCSRTNNTQYSAKHGHSTEASKCFWLFIFFSIIHTCLKNNNNLVSVNITLYIRNCLSLIFEVYILHYSFIGNKNISH